MDHYTIISLLYVELVLPHRNAIDKLERRPQSMELCAFIDVDYAVRRGLALGKEQKE